ncbi:MAG: flagellar basal body P-ring formation chaperone FlgA, partial [Planctomycetota bacterium]
APDWAASVDSESNPIITRVHVLGRGRGRTCEGTVTIRWQPRPAIVVANKPLRRGHQVSRFDLIQSPRPRAFGEKPCVEDPEDLIGLEVTGNVRANVPLLSDDFAAPIAIRRGELIEVRVAGGGVQVTTAAKSLGEGSIGDLIEVETLQPRRRLIARVLDSTMVEILTAPQRSRGKIR